MIDPKILTTALVELEERRLNDCTFDVCDHEREEDHVQPKEIGCGDGQELADIYNSLVADR